MQKTEKRKNKDDISKLLVNPVTTDEMKHLTRHSLFCFSCEVGVLMSCSVPSHHL